MGTRIWTKIGLPTAGHSSPWVPTKTTRFPSASAKHPANPKSCWIQVWLNRCELQKKRKKVCLLCAHQLLTHLSHTRAQQVGVVILTVDPYSVEGWHHNTRTENRQTGATRSQVTPSYLSDTNMCWNLRLAIRVPFKNSDEHTPAWHHSLSIPCRKSITYSYLFHCYERPEAAFLSFNLC